MNPWTIPALLACAAVAWLGAPAAAQPAAIDLGTLGGGTLSIVTAINDRRQVVGYSNTFDDPGGQHAFLWQDGAMRALPSLGGRFTIAYDITDKGRMAGLSTEADGRSQAVVWEPDGSLVVLPKPSGADQCFAVAINDRGRVVGYCVPLTPPPGGAGSVMVLWDDSVAIPLRVPDGLSPVPVDMNDAGVIVGLAYDSATLQNVSFVWEDGVFHDLSALAGREFERVVGINRHGQIAGWGPGSTRPREGLLYDRGTVTVIGPLVGEPNIITHGLNDRGQVVGSSGALAFVWTDGAMRALGPVPGGAHPAAMALNNRGDVAGISTAPADPIFPHAALWPGAGKVAPRRVDR